MDLGVHALKTHPLKSVKRGIGLLNEKVFFGSVTFSPGSYLYADNNGLLVSDELLAPV
jgi:regulator of ribonuclease activity A